MYKISQYISSTDIDEKFKLIYSTRTSEFIRVTKSIYKNIENNNLDKIDDKTLFKLFDSEILVPLDENELDTVLNDFKHTSKEQPDTLNYTIQPSANCQLGCGYCGQIHEKLNLSESKSEKIFKYIKNELNKHKYKKIAITWYGAEPLLGIDGIRYLSKKLISLSHEKKIDYNASIVTNGLAMKENIFEELAKFNIRNYQITLDGTEDYHDNSRYTKKKGKTYKTILNNIVSAVNNNLYKEKKCSVLIRVNIHKENYLDVDNLINELYNLNIHDKISLDFAPIHDWGNNDAENSIGLDPTFFGEKQIEWMIKLKELGFKELIDILPSRRLGTCMVTSNQSELIDTKGRISYCWETPYTPQFDYEGSSFFIGNINDPLNKKDRTNLPLGQWYNDIKNNTLNTWCQRCKFLPICGGSCPINWYKGRPACPSFKYNFEDRMVLQYLEDINYNFTKDE